MTTRYLDFEFNSDFYGLSAPAALELETDERPVSADPDARYEEFVVSYRLVVACFEIPFYIHPEKLAALLLEHLNDLNGVPA